MQRENGAESCLATNHKLNNGQDGWMDGRDGREIDGWRRDRQMHGWMNGRETNTWIKDE